MARFKNSTIAVKKALETPVEMLLSEAATIVSCGLEELNSRFNSMGIDSSNWETIPLEIEPKLMEIKRIVEAEKSITSVADNPEADNPEADNPENSEPSLESPTTDDNPPNEETPQPAVKPKRKRSTALTKKKSESLQQSDQKAQELALSDLQVKQLLHAQKGQKSGAALATIELAAEDATYRKIKGEALTRKVAQLTCEIATENAFDPVELLAELGIDSNTDIYQDLRSQIEPKLGKLGEATEEIVQNAWLNGIHLEDEFTALQKLLNSNDFTVG